MNLKIGNNGLNKKQKYKNTFAKCICSFFGHFYGNGKSYNNKKLNLLGYKSKIRSNITYSFDVIA